MKLDTATYGHPLAAVGAAATAAEEAGYDAWITSEVAYDPFLALAVASQVTSRIQLGTGIAVAFARNPMTVAYQAQNLQEALGDRQLILGLGSQIKPHIRKRFSQEWPERPAAAMREFIQALHAIWDCWNDGAELDFRGEHYSHVLMTPMFTPPATAVRPTVWLAAVGPGMTRVAGQVADGMICHGFTTAKYLEETTLPALGEGIARVEGRARDAVEVSLPVFVISGYDDEHRAATRAAVLQQISFYGSTPAYRPVLEAHGWGELGEELTRLSKAGGWAEMAERIPEEVVEAFAVIADPDELGEAILQRFKGRIDRVTLPNNLNLTAEHLTGIRSRLAAA